MPAESPTIATMPEEVNAHRAVLLPALVVQAGSKAEQRFLEFFTAHIRNPNTRRAYSRAILRFFRWCDDLGLGFHQVEPITVAAFIEKHPGSKPTVKQHLAAIRMLYDWLVTGQVVSFNPASSVRGPRYIIRKGRTPVLSVAETRHLLESIDVTKLGGLRDRALISVMAFSFARVGAALGMRVEDYYREGGNGWLRLHEKGGKLHCVPIHPKAEIDLVAYLAGAAIAGDLKGPLFRAFGRDRHLSQRPMAAIDALKMIKRRAKAASLPENVCCHTFRATGITAYLEAGGTIEGAQAIAGHESPKTTKLYDRRQDLSMVQEVGRIAI
jgi:site-specific recombinase XerD